MKEMHGFEQNKTLVILTSKTLKLNLKEGFKASYININYDTGGGKCTMLITQLRSLRNIMTAPLMKPSRIKYQVMV